MTLRPRWPRRVWAWTEAPVHGGTTTPLCPLGFSLLLLLDRVRLCAACRVRLRSGRTSVAAARWTVRALSSPKHEARRRWSSQTRPALCPVVTRAWACLLFDELNFCFRMGDQLSLPPLRAFDPPHDPAAVTMQCAGHSVQPECSLPAGPSSAECLLTHGTRPSPLLSQVCSLSRHHFPHVAPV